MIEGAIFGILTGAPAVRALVGDRVFPIDVPQGEQKPAITYTRTGGIRDADMGGATGLVESRFLISAHAEGKGKTSAYTVAKTIAGAIETVFQSAGGGYLRHGATEIQTIIINGEHDSRSDGAAGKDAARVSLDCTMFHRQI